MNEFGTHERVQMSVRLFGRVLGTSAHVYYRYRRKPQAALDHISPSIQAVTGYSREELYSDPDLLFRIIHPLDLPTFREILKNPSAFSKPVLLRWRHKSGRIFWAEHYVVPLSGASGSVGILEGFARNITVDKEIEQYLKGREICCRQFMDNIGEAFWLCNQDLTEVYYVNPAYESIWDRDHQSLYDHPESFLESIHPRDKGWVVSSIQADLGQGLNMEFRILWPDGTIRWVRARVFPIVNNTKDLSRIAGIAEDITAYKLIKQRLKEQYNIIDQIHDSVISTDLDGYVTTWNRGAEASLGYSVFQAIGRHISFVYPEDQLDFLEKEVIAPLKEKGTHEVEVQLQDRANRRFHADLSLSLLRDEEGTPKGMVGYFLDISNQIAAAKELQAHVRLHKAVADLGKQALDGLDLTPLFSEAVHVVASILDVDYVKVLELQPEGETLILRAGAGWKKGYVGRATVEACERSQAGYTLKRRKPVVVEDYRTEHRFEKPAILAEHDVQSGVSVVIYGQEKPFGVLGAHSKAIRTYSRSESDFMQAIANILASAIERKSAERALQNSEKRFRSIFENAAAGMVTTDNIDRFLQVNPAFCRFLGYSAEELLARTVREVTFEEDREMTARQFEEVTRGERRVMELIKRYQRKDGRIVWGHTTAAWVFDQHLKPLYSIGLIQDITELKRAENQLRKLSGHLMSVREDEQKRIARKIHDDLGQAIVGMQMNLSWLLDTRPEENEVWLEKIRSLQAVTEEAMDSVERIASELRPRILDVLGLQEAIQWYLKEFGATSGIRYSVRFTPDHPELDAGSAIVLYRVFQEALTNIHRHAEATEVKITFLQQKNELRFLVKDNGVGITPEQIQAPASFGLMGMQERVLSLGGTLDIRGEPGNGTSVLVTIPASSKELSK